MDNMEIIRRRHSVRQYQDRPIPQETRALLDACAEELNREGSLHIQILYDEPECTLSGNRVSARAGKLGSCLEIDLGIVKCHFALGAGRENYVWE